MKRMLLLLAALLMTACGQADKPNQPLPAEKQQIFSAQPPAASSAQQRSSVRRPEKVGAGEKKLLDVPLIAQNPELKYGCEVTSLAMLLHYAGIPVDKMELARKISKDPDPAAEKNGDILRWGDPQDGFVGDITGEHKGYAVYAQPLTSLLDRYMPGRAVNLTGKSFDELLLQVKNNRPVVIWTTGDYRKPDRWEAWKHGSEMIRTPLDLHAVVLVGYEPGFVYINDPLAEKKAHKVKTDTLQQSWKALGKQAVSYR